MKDLKLSQCWLLITSSQDFSQVRIFNSELSATKTLLPSSGNIEELSVSLAKSRLRLRQDQDQRSKPEAESQVQSMSDDVLHAISIPAYKMHRWKEDSCSPNLDGDLVQGANKI